MSITIILDSFMDVFAICDKSDSHVISKRCYGLGNKKKSVV